MTKPCSSAEWPGERLLRIKSVSIVHVGDLQVSQPRAGGLKVLWSPLGSKRARELEETYKKVTVGHCNVLR